MPTRPALTTRQETTTQVTSDNLNKGTELTFAEADSNFFNLRDGTFGVVGDDSSGVDIRDGQTLTVTGTGGITVAVANDTVTIDGSAVAGQTGDLTITGSTILAPSNADLTLTPGGTGRVIIDGLNWPTTDGTAGQYLTTNGAGTLDWDTSVLTSFGDLTATGSTIQAPTNADITLDPNGTGKVIVAGALQVDNQLVVGNITHSTGSIARTDDNQDILISVSQTASTTGAVNLLGAPAGVVNLKGPAGINFDTSDSIGSGNALTIGELFTRFNKGGNDTQNIFVHNNSNTSTTDGLLHIETYANRGTTNGAGMVTINDSSIAYNGSSGKFEGQGTEVFNVFGTARLDNVFFKDNSIYTNRSNEDLELVTAGTGSVIITGLKFPSSDGTNGQVIKTDGSGNLSFTSLQVSNFAASSIVTESEGIGANDNDTTIPTSAAVKAYADSVGGGGGGGTGDLTFVGSTISSPSNADITLDPSGTGDIVVKANVEAAGFYGTQQQAGGGLVTFGTTSLQGKIQIDDGNQILIQPKSGDPLRINTNSTVIGLNTGTASITASAGNNFTLSTSSTNASLNLQAGTINIDPNNGGPVNFDGIKIQGNNISARRSNDDINLIPSGTGTIDIDVPTSTTIGSNGAASALTANPVGYIKIKISGTEYQIPYYNT